MITYVPLLIPSAKAEIS